MCNIAGYSGSRQAASILLEMLRKQQPYDGDMSTGVATIHEGKLYYKKLVGDVTTEFLERFKERFGTLPCRDLKLIKISPEMAPAATAHGINKHCAVLIAEAVAILEELLEELKK